MLVSKDSFGRKIDIPERLGIAPFNRNTHPLTIDRKFPVFFLYNALGIR
jgi:hypothetical protein